MAKKYWECHSVSGTELMAMRMSRGKTCADMVKLQRKYKGILIQPMSVSILDWVEKNLDRCDPDVVEFYMTSLGITNSHMAQFKKILKGKLKTFEEGRTINSSVKKEIRKKYNNKCAYCGSKTALHFHHIEHFADGGQNTVDNLILLCASCHAEEHKGETAYHMLKKLATK